MRATPFRANEVPVDSPDQGQSSGSAGGMRGWIAARRSFILSQIPAANFNVTGTNFIQTTNNYITLNGTAPVTAAGILVNGADLSDHLDERHWLDPAHPDGTGTNILQISAVDGGNSLSNRTMTVNYTGPTPEAEGSVKSLTKSCSIRRWTRPHSSNCSTRKILMPSIFPAGGSTA